MITICLLFKSRLVWNLRVLMVAFSDMALCKEDDGDAQSKKNYSQKKNGLLFFARKNHTESNTQEWTATLFAHQVWMSTPIIDLLLGRKKLPPKSSKADATESSLVKKASSKSKELLTSIHCLQPRRQQVKGKMKLTWTHWKWYQLTLKIPVQKNQILLMRTQQ